MPKLPVATLCLTLLYGLINPALTVAQTSAHPSVQRVPAQAVLQDYLPDNETFDPQIPTPESVIGHEVGEWHVTHDKLVHYMKELAAVSDRISIEEHSTTYEGRPGLLLTITSPENHRNLTGIRRNHRLLLQPDRSEQLDISTMPAVVWMGYSVHGNEPSGSNASMVVAYRLAASQSQEVIDLLNQTVILLDPSLNPDGLNRFATWANMHKSHTAVTDPASREFNEVWPGGRTNHYWFDLNRDWMTVQHPISRGRIRTYQEWQPNILADFHEMGTSSTYFFQPGVPSRTHPMTPDLNQQLTRALAEYHAEALDERQQLYFTRQVFDDFFYGKGSSYPDIQGTVGILFEQASSRGHAQESIHGVKTFPETIKNQVATSFSTLRGAVELREELHDYKRAFFRDALQEGRRSEIGGWVFGNREDRARNWHLLDMIRKHQIEIYRLAEDLEVDGETWRAGEAWIIPAEQRQNQLVRSMFERRTSFEDSLFYDVSAWTLPYAFNIPFAELGNQQYSSHLLGERVQMDPSFPAGERIGGRSDYAYMFSWDSWYAPRALYRLQREGVRTQTASMPLQMMTAEGLKEFGYGTILIPMGIQEIGSERIEEIIDEITREDAVDVYALSTGLALEGIDLGSRDFRTLERPEVAVVVGRGVSVAEAGEIWHLFDQRMKMPVTLIDIERVSAVDLDRYNVLAMVSGNYSALGSSAEKDIAEWVSGGGTLIAIGSATRWARQADLARFDQVQPVRDETSRYPYAELAGRRGAQVIGGSIFNAKLDTTHPLGYGYSREELTVFRNSNRFITQDANAWASPLVYDEENPLAAGYISAENLEVIGGTSSIIVSRNGSGRVISMADNPNFRAFWFGTNKLFLNAVFFGQTIQAAAAN